MPAVKRSNEASVYQLKITLLDSKPPIWRRMLVTSDTTLHKLHGIIQETMGWTNSHLHQFILNEEYYSQPEFGLAEEGFEVKNEKSAKLGRLNLIEESRFIYEYDFGDSWHHEIVVEKLLQPDAKMTYPVCIAGKRACPPEDCGGVWGYENFLDAIRRKSHPEHEETLTWIGGTFDSEAFDLNRVNQALRRFR
jgi:hypothetical protein